MDLDDHFDTSELADLFAAVEGEAHSDGGAQPSRKRHDSARGVRRFDRWPGHLR
jgi:hypothetical protein